jgi:hypothetical protein
MQLQLKELQQKSIPAPQRRFNFAHPQRRFNFGCTSQRASTSAAPLNVASTSAAPLNVASTRPHPSTSLQLRLHLQRRFNFGCTSQRRFNKRALRQRTVPINQSLYDACNKAADDCCTKSRHGYEQNTGT